MGKLIKERKRQQKPFSEMTLKTWMLQLAIALEYMHRHKILHRGKEKRGLFCSKVRSSL